MGFSEHIRRIIYTTNAVEALHRQIRKVTKTRDLGQLDKSLNQTDISYSDIWKRRRKRDVFGWKIIAKELQEKFGEKIKKTPDDIKTMLKRNWPG